MNSNRRFCLPPNDMVSTGATGVLMRIFFAIFDGFRRIMRRRALLGLVRAACTETRGGFSCRIKTCSLGWFGTCIVGGFAGSVCSAQHLRAASVLYRTLLDRRNSARNRVSHHSARSIANFHHARCLFIASLCARWKRGRKASGASAVESGLRHLRRISGDLGIAQRTNRRLCWPAAAAHSAIAFCTVAAHRKTIASRFRTCVLFAALLSRAAQTYLQRMHRLLALHAQAMAPLLASAHLSPRLRQKEEEKTFKAHGESGDAMLIAGLLASTNGDLRRASRRDRCYAIALATYSPYRFCVYRIAYRLRIFGFPRHL